MEIKLEFTTDGVKNICSECGEEVRSSMHRCNPFRDVKLTFLTKNLEEKDSGM